LPGLGSEFALRVRDGLTRIEQYPEAWQLLGRRARRYRRFPYGLVYAPLASEIVVWPRCTFTERPTIGKSG
jgi:hypothetical protein